MLRKLSLSEPAPPWTFMSAITAMLAFFAALVIGTTLAQAVLDADAPGTALAGWILGALFTIALVIIPRRSKPHEIAALRLGPTRSRLPVVLLFCLGMAILIDLISLAVTGQFWPSSEVLGFFAIRWDNALVPRDLSWTAWPLAFAFMAGAQPIAEELVFRGVMLPALRSVLGAWTGLLMTSIFHAGFHLLAYAPALDDSTRLWYALGMPFLIALVLGGVRVYTGSTRAAIVGHIGFGIFAVLKAFTLT